MSEIPVKEINIKIEKIGVIHYFGMTYPENAVLDTDVCEDCGKKGKEAKQYTKIMGGKRDAQNKPVWKTVCDECVKAYTSEDRDMTVTTKLGDYDGKAISITKKPYKPYTRTCEGCDRGVDLHMHPIFNVVSGGDIKGYCRSCFMAFFPEYNNDLCRKGLI